MVVTTLSCILFYGLGAASSLVYIIGAIASIGLAKGLFIAPNRHRMMESAPPHKLGAVNGVLETTTRAGVALGICAFEAVFSAWLPNRGADYLHMPAAVLDAGFRAAFLMGILASLVGLASSAIAVEDAKAAEPCITQGMTFVFGKEDLTVPWCMDRDPSKLPPPFGGEGVNSPRQIWQLGMISGSLPILSIQLP